MVGCSACASECDNWPLAFRVNARNLRVSLRDRRRWIRFFLLVFGPYMLMRPSKSEPLPTSFPCLFCNHDKSVQVKLDKKGGIGELSCKVCGQHFQSGINCKSDLQSILDHPTEEQELWRNDRSIWRSWCLRWLVRKHRVSPKPSEICIVLLEQCGRKACLVY